MVIDYSRYPIKDFLKARSNDDHSPCYCEYEGDVVTPYGTKLDIQYLDKPFFRKEEVKRQIKDGSRKGISIKTDTQGNSDVKGFARVTLKDKKGVEDETVIGLDSELLMPKLAVQPKDYDELKMLVLSDPRFLRQIVPSPKILDPNNHSQLVDFMSVMEEAVEGVLYSQIEMNVAWNKEEQQVCDGYKDECIDAHKEFVQSLVKNVVKFKAEEGQQEQ